MSVVHIYIWPKTQYCFLDIATTIRSAFHHQGIKCRLANTISTQVPVIILGANLINRNPIPLPPNAIILNMEQLYDESPWLTPTYIDVLKTHTVWDYNRSNAAYLKKLLGRDHIPLIKLGYTPDLEFLYDTDQPLDVLFYGEINARRRAIYNKLVEAGITSMVFKSGIVGSQKMVHIARAKIVLNLHYYDAALLEIPRIYHLLHCRKFVISEDSANLDEYGDLEGAFVVCPYDRIVATVLEYLGKPEKRDEIAERGYQLIKQIQPLVPKIESLINPASTISHSGNETDSSTSMDSGTESVPLPKESASSPCSKNGNGTETSTQEPTTD